MDQVVITCVKEKLKKHGTSFVKFIFP